MTMFELCAGDVRIGEYILFDGMFHKIIGVTKESITHIVYTHATALIPQVRYLDNHARVCVVRSITF